MQKIIISGCSGHMGRVVESLCAADPQVQVAAGFDILGSSDRDFPVFSSPAQFSGEAADETGTQREALCAALCGQCARQVASLAGVNKTVLRFVPENLLRLIGAQSLEQIDKTAFVKADMTTLLVRFIFPDGTPQTADALFSAINRVIERIAPLVSANGGTVYDFRHDGFHAVFSGEPADAVRCAIQIREAQSALNAADDCRVDIRAAIVSGEVLLGIIGDEQRMSPTAVSDAMDTARRMMDLCWDS